jgi:Flp pilus assembly pilin Flp
MLISLRNLWSSEDGVAAVEYAVLISVTVSLLAAGLYFYGNALEQLYNNLGGTLF